MSGSTGPGGRTRSKLYITVIVEGFVENAIELSFSLLITGFGVLYEINVGVQ